jgi:hypothetical protein
MPGNDTLYKSQRGYLPIVWTRNNIPQGVNAPLDAAGLPAGLNDFPILFTGSVTGLVVVLSEPITAGGIEVRVRKNGVVTTTDLEVSPSDGTGKVLAIAPGSVDFAVGDRIGLQVVAEAGLAPNAQIDLAAYAEFQNV